MIQKSNSYFVTAPKKKWGERFAFVRDKNPLKMVFVINVFAKICNIFAQYFLINTDNILKQ
jgi:hypothetical protein